MQTQSVLNVKGYFSAGIVSIIIDNVKSSDNNFPIEYHKIRVQCISLERGRTDLSLPLQVDQVEAGCQTDGLPLPLIEVLHGRHGVEHLVANHLLPQWHGLPPDLKFPSIEDIVWCVELCGGAVWRCCVHLPYN